MEIWKDISNYENLYQVSNLGRVRSITHTRKNGREKNHVCISKGKMLTPGKDNSGYMVVVLSKNGKTKSYRVHRLVAQEFLENKNNFKCINHKDENKANNKADNLEWCNHKYNNNYGTKPQRISKANSIKVNQYDKDYNFIKTWDSLTEASKYLKKDRADVNISKCCKLKAKSAYGYIWRYTNVNSLQKE